MKVFYCSTCFECYYIHPQELPTVCGCSAATYIRIPPYSSRTAPIHQYTPRQSSTPTYSRQLLRMNVIAFETCWAIKNFHKVTSSWFNLFNKSYEIWGSQQWLWGLLSPGMQCHVCWLITVVAEKSATSIFRVCFWSIDFLVLTYALHTDHIGRLKFEGKLVNDHKELADIFNINFISVTENIVTKNNHNDSSINYMDNTVSIHYLLKIL